MNVSSDAVDMKDNSPTDPFNMPFYKVLDVSGDYTL